MKKLFTPIKIGNVEIKNRLVMPSMCVHFCDKEGYVNECMTEYVRQRAAGGPGLIIIPGSTHGKCGPGRPAISDDKYIPGWQTLIEAVHEHGAKLFCQLHPAKAQAGRGHKIENPEDFSAEDIETLIECYASGAERCKRAGVDGVDIHGGHAHEIAMFMSPLYNKRTDEYGGDYRGRALFAVRIVKAIKKRCGDGFPVIFRLSGDEMVSGGRGIDESVKISALLEQAGADAIHVSVGMPESGGYISAPMDVEDCFNVENAAKVKAGVGIPVIAVNRIVDVAQAVEIVESGKADMVSMARALLADPELVNKYLGINDLPVRRCVGCNQGCRDSAVRKKIICLQNPFLGVETELKLIPAQNPEMKILIAGAGPAGLEMACSLAARGFSPVIFEKSEEAGGQVLLAAKPPHKRNMLDIVNYRLAYLKKFGVPIHYGKEVTKELLAQEKPDVLVIATGSEPVIPAIPGADGQHTADEVLVSGIEGNKIAVIGGGLAGCETADYLAALGKEVVVFDVIEKFAENLNSSRRNFMLKRLSGMPVTLVPQSRVEEIRLPEIVISGENGREVMSGFDGVVIAVGRKPVQAPADVPAGIKVITIGDASRVGLALDAIHQAAAAAAAI